MAADLKFPAWPAPQPIVLLDKPMRPKGSTKKRKADWLDQESSQYEVDLADVDITQLGKMLNPEQNVAKLKRAKARGARRISMTGAPSSFRQDHTCHVIARESRLAIFRRWPRRASQQGEAR